MTFKEKTFEMSRRTDSAAGVTAAVAVEMSTAIPIRASHQAVLAFSEAPEGALTMQVRDV